MKTIVFINFPVTGHINPQYELCKELAKRDVKLIYFTAEKYKHKYDNIENLIVETYPKEFMDYYTELENNQELSEKFMALSFVFYTLTEHIIDFMIERVGVLKPDLIISDTLAIWGKISARHYNIPYSLFFSSYMGDTKFLLHNPALLIGIIRSVIFDFNYIYRAMKIRRKIENKYGKVTDSLTQIMSHQGKFSMVYTSRSFHPCGGDYGDNIHFIKPSIFNENPIMTKKDSIFISVGTISYSKSFWDVCLEATQHLKYRIVISFGDNRNNSIDRSKMRKNVEVYDNLSLEKFRSELERSVLFITHGGFNSISDSVVAETKMLVCPVTTENLNNGKVIERYGCGKVLKTNKLTAIKLRKDIDNILAIDCQENLKKQKESFIREKTCQNVVDALIKEYKL